MREDLLFFFGSQGFNSELKPVRKVVADANLKRLHHKVMYARTKSAQRVNLSRMAKPIAMGRGGSPIDRF